MTPDYATFDHTMTPCARKCPKCGFAFEEHATALPEEVELLRSLGFGVFVCKDVEDGHPFLEGVYLEVVAMKDDKFLNSFDIEEIYNNREPDNPCDSGFMEEISE